ncbi:MAG: hypothetical protein GXY42_07000 [Desulfovibrionales bacterium]|nr:hypothetical protein [Desulfovibrionales bacterium]
MASIWVSRPDLEDLIGPEAALALLTAFPGRRIYIPAKATSEKFTDIVGSVANEILSNEFRGYEVCLPNVVKPVTLKEKILPLLEAGLSLDDVARQCECTVRYVCMVRADMTFRRKPAPKPRRRAEREA